MIALARGTRFGWLIAAWLVCCAAGLAEEHLTVLTEKTMHMGDTHCPSNHFRSIEPLC